MTSSSSTPIYIPTPASTYAMQVMGGSPTSKSAGKILGGAKLSRENYESFFQALDFWATMRKLRWIYSDNEKHEQRRDGSKETEEMEMGNAVVMTLLMGQLEPEDLGLISGISDASEVVKELRRKYYDKRPAKVEQDIARFYTYRLGKKETIMQAWAALKTLARQIASEDKEKYAHMAKDEGLIYSRLLYALPEEYQIMVDGHRVRPKDSVHNKLAELQEKEANLLANSDASAHYSRDNPKSRHSGYHPRRRSSSSSSCSSNSSKRAKQRLSCRLCGQSGHFVHECPHLDEAARHISRSRSNSKTRSEGKKILNRKASNLRHTRANSDSDSEGEDNKNIQSESDNGRPQGKYGKGKSHSESRKNQFRRKAPKVSKAYATFDDESSSPSEDSGNDEAFVALYPSISPNRQPSSSILRSPVNAIKSFFVPTTTDSSSSATTNAEAGRAAHAGRAPRKPPSRASEDDSG